jgi:hypothetical protein
VVKKSTKVLRRSAYSQLLSEGTLFSPKKTLFWLKQQGERFADDCAHRQLPNARRAIRQPTERDAGATDDAGSARAFSAHRRIYRRI